MSQILKNTSIYTLGRILPQLAGFILLPLYTKYLSPDDYGIVQSLQTISAILIIFFSLATERSMARLYFDYKTVTDQRNLVGNGNILIFTVATVFLGLVFLFKNQVSQVYSSIDFHPYYTYAILNAYILTFTNIPRIVLQVKEKAGIFLWSSLAQFIAGVVFILWFVVYRNEGAAGMLKGQLIGTIVIFPWFLYLIIKQSRFKFNLKKISAIFFYSIPLVPMLLFSWVNNLSDRIFIEQYFNLHDVGIYSLGYKIAGMTLLITGSFYAAYSPIFYRIANDSEVSDPKGKLKQYNLTYILIVLFLNFSIAFVAREMILLFLDSKYADAWVIVNIICFANIIGGISGLFNLMIYQQKKTVSMMIIVMISAMVNVGMNFILIPKVGYIGAAIVT
ncbi:MAG: oligosaccharide flippase family protein, partial [Bacteroidota bacterium]